MTSTNPHGYDSELHLQFKFDELHIYGHNLGYSVNLTAHSYTLVAGKKKMLVDEGGI